MNNHLPDVPMAYQAHEIRKVRRNYAPTYSSNPTHSYLQVYFSCLYTLMKSLELKFYCLNKN